MVREWDIYDLPAIREIALKTWTDTYLNIFTKEEITHTHKQFYSVDRLRRLLKNRAGFVCVKNTAVVAYLIAEREDKNRRFYINSFYVLPENQGKDIGKRLLKIAIQEARSIGQNKVWLDVMAKNRVAIEWYIGQDFIFTETGTFTMGNTTTATKVGYKTI